MVSVHAGLRESLAGAAALVALLLATVAAEASSLVIIKYELGGTVTNRHGGFEWNSPVHSPGAPGPGGIGSMVTFALAATPAGDPIASGNVSLRSLVVSHGLTFYATPSYIQSGFRRLSLTGLPRSGTYGTALPGTVVPITGGHLSGLTALGSGSGLAFRTGVKHCYGTVNACTLVGVDGYQISIPLPLGPANGIPTPFGQWAFNAAFSTVQAQRGTLSQATILSSHRTSLVGTEIGRTVIPMPEPRPLELLAPALAVLGLMAVRRSVRRAGHRENKLRSGPSSG